MPNKVLSDDELVSLFVQTAEMSPKEVADLNWEGFGVYPWRTVKAALEGHRDRSYFRGRRGPGRYKRLRKKLVAAGMIVQDTNYKAWSKSKRKAHVEKRPKQFVSAPSLVSLIEELRQLDNKRKRVLQQISEAAEKEMHGE